MSDNKNTLLSFVFGVLVGATLVVLCAPKSGKETGRNIRKFGEEVVGTVGDLCEDLTETGRKVYEEGKKILYGKDKIGETFEAEKKFLEDTVKRISNIFLVC